MEAGPLTFTTLVGRLGYLNMHCVEIPAAVVSHFGGTFKGRFLVTVNDRVTWQGGLMTYGNGMAYIMFSVKNMKAAGAQAGDTITVRMEKDTSPYGLPMPEELQVLLEQDYEADKRFHALTPGKQRWIITWVSTVKDSQKRIDRSVLIMTNLKSIPPGKETFRLMVGLD